jgi:hypothetical protein
LSGCDGCTKKQDAASDAGGTGPALDTAARADAAPTTVKESADPGAAKHEMSNCPTAVPGAAVAIKDVEGGVEVTVVGKDEATTSAIRERATKLAAADRTSVDGGVKHDHSGAGGGKTGRCTIIMRGTDLAISDVPSGSKVVVKAKSASELDWLRRETRERDTEAKAASSESAGGHRMAQCPSAVEGAKTVVKDTKEGVLVTITGRGDAVGEIRTRAKHAAEVASKPEPSKVAHTGSGTGGGGLGRCPVVVSGDTSVDVREVEGGVAVDVKTKKDVAALQSEAKLRAANFASKE